MADQNFMDLASKTASGITGTDYMMLVNNSEAYKALVNDVAEAILGKLTSKSFSGLETTAKNVIGALNELNSNIGRIGKNTITDADLFVYAKSCAEGITVFRTNDTVTNSPANYTEGYIVKADNNITIVCFNMATVEMFLTQKQATSENFLQWKKALLQDLS